MHCALPFASPFRLGLGLAAALEEGDHAAVEPAAEAAAQENARDLKRKDRPERRERVARRTMRRGAPPVPTGKHAPGATGCPRIPGVPSATPPHVLRGQPPLPSTLYRHARHPFCSPPPQLELPLPAHARRLRNGRLLAERDAEALQQHRGPIPSRRRQNVPGKYRPSRQGDGSRVSP